MKDVQLALFTQKELALNNSNPRPVRDSVDQQNLSLKTSKIIRLNMLGNSQTFRFKEVFKAMGKGSDDFSQKYDSESRLRASLQYYNQRTQPTSWLKEFERGSGIDLFLSDQLLFKEMYIT